MIAGRFNSGGLSRWCFSAHPGHRWTSRFVPSTVSTKCTVASLGQHWHFTPSSFSGVPRSSTLLELADPVAQAGGIFIGLAVDGLLQLLAQLHQLRLGLTVLGQSPRGLAAVPGFAV